MAIILLNVLAALAGGCNEARFVSDGAGSGIPGTGTETMLKGPFEYARVRMGTKVRILLYAGSRDEASNAANAAFSRIAVLEEVLSDYLPGSEARLITRGTPGQPREISEDLMRILLRSKAISSRTHGAFDVTCGPLTRLWRQAIDLGELPDEEHVAAATSRVGWTFMSLDASMNTVRFELVDMELDFGAIGKGWAADEALSILESMGCPHALIEMGGDLAIGLPPPGLAGWPVGVSLDAGTAAQRVFLSSCGVATSGDAERFMEVEGVRYSHILDPRTGWSLDRSCAVTIVAPDAATADALASAFCVLGPVMARPLIEGWPGVFILVDSMNEHLSVLSLRQHPAIGGRSRLQPD